MDWLDVLLAVPRRRTGHDGSKLVLGVQRTEQNNAIRMKRGEGRCITK